MTSLWLPAPKKGLNENNNLDRSNKISSGIGNNNSIISSNRRSSKKKRLLAPSYEERCRSAVLASQQRKAAASSGAGGQNGIHRKHKISLFVPRKVEDFDDGGAFPEIHVAQYPRNMGNPHLSFQKKNNNNGNNGNGRSLAIVKGAMTTQSQKKSSYEDLVPTQANENKGGKTSSSDDRDSLALADGKEEEEMAQRTLALLEKKQQPNDDGSQKSSQFISYTPRPDAPGYNPAAAPKRVIQMVSAQVDPMAPPKHMHRKAPNGPMTEEFTPVLHKANAKLTKEEREAWNIPACISNWKNTRGYTIPLDKRLAADGRGLVDNTTINPNFATLSESLYVAERQARQEVKMRAQVQQSLALQQKQQQEQHLRQLAQQARLHRNSTATTAAATTPNDDKSSSQKPHVIHDDHTDDNHNTENSKGIDEDLVAAQQRERLRVQRKKEREREYRMEQRQSKGQEEDEDLVKKRRLEADRDVSEKIALGVHTGNANNNNNQVDSRLYNMSSGLDSGYAGPDDEYNTYSKPLFDQNVIHSNIYKPSSINIDPDQQYKQLVQGGNDKFDTNNKTQRTGPVQFHKSNT